MASGIYKYTNLINGHTYIGQSIDIQKRYREHKSAALNPQNRDHNLPIHLALAKYTLDNFSFEIIEECPADKDILNERETYWIEYYQSYTNGNYNISKGGDNKEHIGKPVELYDMEGNFVKEICNAATAAREINISYSTVQQVLHQKRSSCGGYQLKYKDDPREMHPYKTRQGGKLPVDQYSKEGLFIATYESAKAAALATGADPSGITKVCKGKLKSTKGYIWNYHGGIE